jgi:hypothetical protein
LFFIIASASHSDRTPFELLEIHLCFFTVLMNQEDWSLMVSYGFLLKTHSFRKKNRDSPDIYQKSHDHTLSSLSSHSAGTKVLFFFWEPWNTPRDVFFHPAEVSQQSLLHAAAQEGLHVLCHELLSAAKQRGGHVRFAG